MPMVQEVKTEKVQAFTFPVQAWYWFGMLPSNHPISIKRNLAAEDQKTGEYFTLMQKSAWEAWSKPGKERPIFAGKCPQYQTLEVNGWSFPSVNYVIESVGAEQSKIPFPGSASLLIGEQAERIVRNCWRHVLRFTLGADQAYEPDSPCAVLDLKYGAKPDGYSDADWQRSKHELMKTSDGIPVFTEMTDRYLAEYVYLIKLDAPLTYDVREYKRNPNKLHEELIGTRMNREFFEHPPKSVAETYPQFAPRGG